MVPNAAAQRPRADASGLDTLSITVRCNRLLCVGHTFTRRQLHKIVGVRLTYVMKTQAFIERQRAMILQSRRKRHHFAFCVSAADCVTKKDRADSPPLVRGCDLYFANLNRVWMLENLDHADTLTIDLHALDTAALPAL